jgi:hypothetical protein
MQIKMCFLNLGIDSNRELQTAGSHERIHHATWREKSQIRLAARFHHVGTRLAMVLRFCEHAPSSLILFVPG